MAQQISKMIIDMSGEEYEMTGGGGGIVPGVPIPADTVDSAAIIDGAVQEQDLNASVKDLMTVTHDSATGGLRLGGYAKSGSVPANVTQEAGALEEEVTGDGPDLDDLPGGGFEEPMNIEEGD